MKICASLVLGVVGLSTVSASGFMNLHGRELADAVDFPAGLTKPALSTYPMKPVRTVQARVQSDSPVWNADYGMFVSSFYKDFPSAFRAVLDTVNTASVEGALLYVQAEGINYNSRSAEQKCVRKNKMRNIVFYDIVYAQSNETIAEYGDVYGEYGPMLPMDGGQCTPSGTSFSKGCNQLNGTNGEALLGPFVGGEDKSTDPRAPYPNARWFSFPNTCPLSPWANKTDTCRDSTRKGLCDYNVMPDGITCTFNYRILGYMTIDDLVGITTMDSGKYKNFTEFCNAGGVEFKGDVATGVWSEGIDFWKDPTNSSANADRAAKMIKSYTDLQSKAFVSKQIDAGVVEHFKPLPTIADLQTSNPPCYFNVKACATAQYGCKREFYGQLCRVCTASDTGCTVNTDGIVFPTLTKATPAPDSASTPPAVTEPGASSSPPTAPGPSPSSASTLSVMTVASVAATFAMSYLM